MDQRTILELAETEIPVHAHSMAGQIAEPLLNQIVESVRENLHEWLMDNLPDDELEQVALDLIEPAYAMHVTDHLAYLLRDACAGWRSVFWTNMAERYEATREVQ